MSKYSQASVESKPWMQAGEKSVCSFQIVDKDASKGVCILNLLFSNDFISNANLKFLVVKVICFSGYCWGRACSNLAKKYSDLPVTRRNTSLLPRKLKLKVCGFKYKDLETKKTVVLSCLGTSFLQLQLNHKVTLQSWERLQSFSLYSHISFLHKCFVKCLKSAHLINVRSIFSYHSLPLLTIIHFFPLDNPNL